MELMSTAAAAAAGAAIARAVSRLREHRTEPAGLADLLGWGFLIGDGIVLQKDGSLLAGFRYAGPDVSAATPAELDALSRHVNDAIIPFADDWMFHVDAVRRPAAAYTAGVFPDALSQLIDEERRASYGQRASQQFETTYTLVVTHIPPPELFSRLSAWFIQGADRTAIDWDTVLAGFGVALDTLERRLAARLRLRRLESDALVTHLHECLTGDGHPVRAPAHGSYLNVVLVDQDLIGGFEPRIGAQHIRAVSVQGYPHASYAGALDVLNTIPHAFRWSNRLLPLGQQAAGRLIRRHQLDLVQEAKGRGRLAAGARRRRSSKTRLDPERRR